MLVSVVITTKNEERNIANCLKSVLDQSYKEIEIIVVDNNSTDKTKDIVESFKVASYKAGCSIQLFNHGPERSAQRNYGMIEKAKGEYVMFLDADMALSPDLIKSCVEFIGSGNYAALYISEIVSGDNFWSRVRRFERSFYDGTVIDGARFFRRDLFVKVGGFDETMSGPEDWDIDKKIKQIGTIGLVPVSKIGRWGLPAIFSLDRLGMVSEVEPERETRSPDEGYRGLPRRESRFGAENGRKTRGLLLKKLFSRRALVPAGNDRAVIYHNEAKFDFKKYLSKKGYYAASFESYINKWGKDDPDIKKQFGISYRYFGVFLENGKWKKLVAHPVLAVGMFTLRFLVGLRYLAVKFHKNKS